MKVEYSRPHRAGAMAGIGKETKVVELVDGSPVPEGAVEVPAETEAHDWEWGVKSTYTRGGK